MPRTPLSAPLSQQFLGKLDYSPQALLKARLAGGMPDPQAAFSKETFMADLMAGVSPLRRPIMRGLMGLFS